ncbi:MAG: hypothetical protein GYA55_15045 [SAR324 cluster bacterium]|uniref:DUF4124 domain-containing protein n=1 Tax=SAR324 cluster bacterium TaxID=2024889 RepID=A0A7X9IL77_9DELT|nr:hypothetical protein [SAR324 cluster bacterium]
MKFAFSLLTLALFPCYVFADGVPSDTPSSGSMANAPVNKASDASFDKRLPPVLPGERMNDSGHEVRVWSSSGPVPVSQAPEPFKDKQLVNDVVRNQGIVIDERRDRFDRRPGDNSWNKPEHEQEQTSPSSQNAK